MSFGAGRWGYDAKSWAQWPKRQWWDDSARRWPARPEFRKDAEFGFSGKEDSARRLLAALQGIWADSYPGGSQYEVVLSEEGSTLNVKTTRPDGRDLFTEALIRLHPSKDETKLCVGWGETCSFVLCPCAPLEDHPDPSSGEPNPSFSVARWVPTEAFRKPFKWVRVKRALDSFGNQIVPKQPQTEETPEVEVKVVTEMLKEEVKIEDFQDDFMDDFPLLPAAKSWASIVKQGTSQKSGPAIKGLPPPKAPAQAKLNESAKSFEMPQSKSVEATTTSPTKSSDFTSSTSGGNISSSSSDASGSVAAGYGGASETCGSPGYVKTDGEHSFEPYTTGALATCNEGVDPDHGESQNVAGGTEYNTSNAVDNANGCDGFVDWNACQGGKFGQAYGMTFGSYCAPVMNQGLGGCLLGCSPGCCGQGMYITGFNGGMCGYQEGHTYSMSSGCGDITGFGCSSCSSGEASNIQIGSNSNQIEDTANSTTDATWPASTAQTDATTSTDNAACSGSTGCSGFTGCGGCGGCVGIIGGCGNGCYGNFMPGMAGCAGCNTFVAPQAFAVAQAGGGYAIIVPVANMATAEPTIAESQATDELEPLRSQIEFYFSDENLGRDMYMRKQMSTDGFVPLITLAGFKRIRMLAPLNVGGEQGIIGLLGQALSMSTELELDPTWTKVRRRNGWHDFLVTSEETA